MSRARSEKTWFALYGGSPWPTDMAWLAVAVAVHLPLLTLSMSDPKSFSRGGLTLHRIQLIETQTIERRASLAAPAALPRLKPAPEERKKPEAPSTAKRPAPVLPRVLAPALPPPELKMAMPPAALLQSRALSPRATAPPRLAGREGFQGQNRPAGGSSTLPDMKGGGATAVLSVGGRAGGPGGAVLEGKKGFAVAAGSSLSSIGGRSDAGGIAAGPVVVVTVAARPRADASVLSPVVKGRSSSSSAGPPGVARPGGPAGGIGIKMGGSLTTLDAGAGRGAVPAAAARGRPGSPDGIEKSFSESQTFLDASRSFPAASVPIRRAAAPPRPLFTIAGPLADRPVVHRTLPVYPDWARAQGVEAAVTLQFSVTAEGRVKDNILLVRTSGYPAMDRLAAEALRTWLFSNLPADRAREEVGSITMTFFIR